MQLQVAFDRIELDEALGIADAVAPYADWIEVGTSLIKRYGMRSVTELVARSGDTPVLADLKTADDASTEFGMAFEHGASAATVLAAAADATIDRSVALAAESGGETVLDLMEVTQQRRDALLDRLPPEVVFAAHIPKDAQQVGHDVAESLGSWVRGRAVAVAGGLTEEDIFRLHESHPGVRVIVGSAVTKAPSPRDAASRMFSVVKGGGS